MQKLSLSGESTKWITPDQKAQLALRLQNPKPKLLKEPAVSDKNGARTIVPAGEDPLSQFVNAVETAASQNPFKRLHINPQSAFKHPLALGTENNTPSTTPFATRDQEEAILRSIYDNNC